MRIRRRRFCTISIEDRPFPDMEKLAAGEVQMVITTQSYLLCPLTGESLFVAPEELSVLAALSGSEWMDPAALTAKTGIDEEEIRSLVRRKILVSDGPESAEIRHGETQLDSVGWHYPTALYHARTRLSGVAAEPEMEKSRLAERLERHAETHGPPPAPDVRRGDAKNRLRLPGLSVGATLAELLGKRRTTRAFLTDRELPLEELSVVLGTVFGSRKAEEVGKGIRFLKKTSPSAGGLHPVEAYPIVVKVRGVPSGIYHYCVADHTLELLEEMDEGAARGMITAFTAGQRYFAEAHAVIIHVARFDRAYWKYRGHPKLYKALHLDSAHLSQTLYLVAAERELGAYVTAVINDGDIAERLRLDPYREGAIAMNGIGIPDPSRAERHFEPR